MPDAIREDTQAFAWDGISCSVPAGWDLSSHSLRNRVSRVTMEDAFGVRLELEWTRPGQALDDARVRRRCAQASDRLREAAMRTEALANLPSGWMAALHTMPGQRHLVVAFFLSSAPSCFCFLRLHFDASSDAEPHRVLASIASTFRLHEGPAVPWRFYDVACSLPRCLQLVETAFLAGNKRLTFEWRLRRLHLWFVSLADLALRQKSLDAWAADFLNGQKAFRGPVFEPGAAGGVVARRSRLYPCGHFEEIGRWTLRYRVICRRDSARNQIVLAVFNYRRPSDLKLLEGLDAVR